MDNSKIDETAYVLDRVFTGFDLMVTEMSKAITDGVIPVHVAADALRKMRQAREKLLETVVNQDRLQLACALDELRSERIKA